MTLLHAQPGARFRITRVQVELWEGSVRDATRSRSRPNGLSSAVAVSVGGATFDVLR
jgi:hypothetical protein